MLNFVAFLGVASLFIIGVDNRKSEVDNRKGGWGGVESYGGYCLTRSRKRTKNEGNRLEMHLGEVLPVRTMAKEDTELVICPVVKRERRGNFPALYFWVQTLHMREGVGDARRNPQSFDGAEVRAHSIVWLREGSSRIPTKVPVQIGKMRPKE